MKSFFMVILGALAAIYLINPTAGIFELLPDVIPGIGHIDEAAAMTVLLGVLSYFGIDLDFKKMFGTRRQDKKGDDTPIETKS